MAFIPESCGDVNLSDLWPVQPPAEHINVHVRVQFRRDEVWANQSTSSVPNPFQGCVPCPPSSNIGHSLYLPVHFASISEARATPLPPTVANHVGTYKLKRFFTDIDRGIRRKFIVLGSVIFLGHSWRYNERNVGMRKGVEEYQIQFVF